MIRITDVTITYNDAEGLIKTLESLFAQEYSETVSLQVVVIDGGSSDNTQGVLEEYTDKFREKGIEYEFISESDNGIYDAMNKGILRAKGEWIMFLNAGDVLAESDTLRKMAEHILKDDINHSDVFYGDSIRTKSNGQELYLKPLPIAEIKKGMPFCHQSTLTRTELFRKRPYDTNFKISGDYEWFLGAYTEGQVFSCVPVCVCKFDASGVSSRKLYDNYIEAERVRSKYGVADKPMFRRIKAIAWFCLDRLHIGSDGLVMIAKMASKMRRS